MTIEEFLKLQSHLPYVKVKTPTTVGFIENIYYNVVILVDEFGNNKEIIETNISDFLKWEILE